MNRYSGARVESPLFRMTVRLFYIMAVIRAITALVHIARLVQSGYSPAILMDVVFNLTVAALAYVCAGMVQRRRVLVIPAFVGVTLVTIAYAISLGRGINFAVIALAAFFLLCLWVLRRRAEIT